MTKSCPAPGDDGVLSRICCGPSQRGQRGGDGDTCTLARRGEWLSPLDSCATPSNPELDDLQNSAAADLTPTSSGKQVADVARRLAMAVNRTAEPNGADVAIALSVATLVSQASAGNASTEERRFVLDNTRAAVDQLLKLASKSKGLADATRGVLTLGEKNQGGSTRVELAPDPIVDYAGSVVEAFRMLARDAPSSEKRTQFSLGSFNVSLLADSNSSTDADIDVGLRLASKIPTAVRLASINASFPALSFSALIPSIFLLLSHFPAPALWCHQRHGL